MERLRIYTDFLCLTRTSVPLISTGDRIVTFTPPLRAYAMPKQRYERQYKKKTNVSIHNMITMECVIRPSVWYHIHLTLSIKYQIPNITSPHQRLRHTWRGSSHFSVSGNLSAGKRNRPEMSLGKRVFLILNKKLWTLPLTEEKWTL